MKKYILDINKLVVDYAECFKTPQLMTLFRDAVHMNQVFEKPAPVEDIPVMNLNELTIMKRDGKAAAIKAFRTRTGLGLKEAKELADMYCDVVEPGPPQW